MIDYFESIEDSPQVIKTETEKITNDAK